MLCMGAPVFASGRLALNSLMPPSGSVRTAVSLTVGVGFDRQKRAHKVCFGLLIEAAAVAVGVAVVVVAEIAGDAAG